MPNKKRSKIQTHLVSTSGFTLIELMVTMAIVSIVLAAVISMYTGLTRSYVTETARATAQQEIRSGIRLMAQDIRLAGLDPLGTAGGGITLTTQTDIEVIADRNYDGSVTGGNMERIRYFLSGNRLIQRVDNNGATDEVLVDNITALSFTVALANDGITPLLADDGITPLVIEINMTVSAPAGRAGTVTRTLTERVKLRNG